MKELIENLKNKKFKYIQSYELNPFTGSRTGNPVIRRIVKVDDIGVYSVSNLIKDSLRIFNRFPEDGKYELIENGYKIEVDCGKFGNKKVEITFLNELPFKR